MSEISRKFYYLILIPGIFFSACVPSPVWKTPEAGEAIQRDSIPPAIKEFITSTADSVDYLPLVKLSHNTFGDYRGWTWPDSLTKEQALQDVDMLEYLFRNAYSGYDYFKAKGVDFHGSLDILRQAIRAANSKASVQNMVVYFQRSFSNVQDGQFTFVYKNKSFRNFKHADAYFADLLIEERGGKYFVVRSNIPAVKPERQYTDDTLMLSRTLSAKGKRQFLLGSLFLQDESSRTGTKDKSFKFNGKPVTLKLHRCKISKRIDGPDETVTYKKYDMVPVLAFQNFSAENHEKLMEYAGYGKYMQPLPLLVLDVAGIGGGSISYPDEFFNYFNGFHPDKYSNGYSARLESPAIIEHDAVSTPRNWVLNSEVQDRVQFSQFYLEDVKKSPMRSWQIKSPNMEEAPTSDYKGLMVAIANSGTGGSGEASLEYVLQLRKSVIVGENTAGVRVFDEPREYVLPNSRIVVTLPSTLNLAPGINEGYGVMPDFWLDTDKPVVEIANWLNNQSTYEFDVTGKQTSPRIVENKPDIRPPAPKVQTNLVRPPSQRGQPEYTLETLPNELKEYVSYLSAPMVYKPLVKYNLDSLRYQHEYPMSLSKAQAIEDIDMLEYLLENAYSGREYFEHHGVDFKGMYRNLRAFVQNESDRIPVQGFIDIMNHDLRNIQDGHFHFEFMGRPNMFFRHNDIFFSNIIVEKSGNKFIVVQSKESGVNVGQTYTDDVSGLFRTLSRRGKEQFLVGVNRFRDLAQYEDTLSSKVSIDGIPVAISFHRCRISKRKDQPTDYLSFKKVDGIPVLFTRDFRTENHKILENYVDYGEELKHEKYFIYDLADNHGGNNQYPGEFFSNLNDVNGNQYTDFYSLNLESCPTVENIALDFRPSENVSPDHRARVTSAKSKLEEMKKDPVKKWDIHAPRPLPLQGSYDGNLYVIMNSRCASSGESAVSFSRSVRNHVFIGENTAGVLALGSMWSYLLPNSRILMNISKSITTTDKEGYGFTPDYWLDSDTPVQEVARWINNPDTYEFELRSSPAFETDSRNESQTTNRSSEQLDQNRQRTVTRQNRESDDLKGSALQSKQETVSRTPTNMQTPSKTTNGGSTDTLKFVGKHDRASTRWTKDDSDQANTCKNISYLSDIEKNVIILCNLARLNGPLFARTYWKEYLETNNYENNKKSIYVETLYEDLNKVFEFPMFQPSEALSNAARFHAQDMGRTGQFSHTSSDGTNSFVRLKRFYSGSTQMAENIASGGRGNSAINYVMMLLIDEGVQSLGHRKNILNPELIEIGTAIEPHKTSHYICVLDFAGRVQGDSEKTISFSTIPPPKIDSSGPRVVYTNPPQGSKDVDPKLKTLTVTFSKAMTGSCAYCVVSDTLYPGISGSSPSLSKDRKTFTLGIELKPHTTYGVWIDFFPMSLLFKDLEGKPALPYKLVFSTQ